VNKCEINSPIRAFQGGILCDSSGMISVSLNMQCDEGSLCFFILMKVCEQLKKRGTHVKGTKVIKKYIFLQFL